MFFFRQLPLSSAIGVIVAAFLIANVDATYTCSKQIIEHTPELFARGRNSLGTLSHLARRLDIDRNLRIQQARIFNGSPNCHSKILFLPVPLTNLRFPTVEVLPDQRVCLNGRILQNRWCMPKNPVAFPFPLFGRRGCLILASSYFGAN